MLVVSASEMASLDRHTIEKVGIPGIVLMENAARGAADFFESMVPDIAQRKITVLAGSGNNGGDGFVLARIFHNKGAEVQVVCLRSPLKLSGDALTNYQILEKLQVPTLVWDESRDFHMQWQWVSQSQVIIDAILGTGLNSEVRGLFREVIEALNKLRAIVLAVDIPSGLDATTGRPLGAAVRAAGTATFGFLKIGQLLEPGSEHVGRLQLVDIGIPQSVAMARGIQRWQLTEEMAAACIQPRSPYIHKGGAGHVAVLSGSRGKTGAATLICEAAGRVGAGLVTLFVPESLNSILEMKLTEAMTFPIAETEEQTPSESASHAIVDFLKDSHVLAAGPGISTHPSTAALLLSLLPRLPCPAVLDADALTLVAQNIPIISQTKAPLVLTPHPGEMARLAKKSVKEVQENRLDTAREFAREHGVVLVLKGHGTVVAAPDGRLVINSTGNPAMASGGMGDTLTGMIAGFLAQGMDAFQAACLSVYTHGAAADEALEFPVSRGLIASDLLPVIPMVLGRLEQKEGRRWNN